MSDQSTTDDVPRPGDGPPPSAGRSRFKGTPPGPPAADSLVVGASELETAYHRVDEMVADEAYFTHRKTDREDNEIDMTPMVDSTFLLLLFFMVTAAFSLQRAQPVPTPHPDAPSANVVQRDPTEDPGTITVHVDENNTFRVVTTTTDVEAPSTHELLIRLREACNDARAGQRPTKLLVMANNEALHERVIAAMDAGSQVGMEEIQLMMVEENE